MVPKERSQMRLWWFSSGALIGLTTLSIALGSVPSRERVTDDTVIYQNMSEIRVARQAALSFDSDIERLAALEPRYREKLPSLAEQPQMRGPIKRIIQRKYHKSEN
jgi:hypothetical protein